MTDAELESIREALYTVAETVVDEITAESNVVDGHGDAGVSVETPPPVAGEDGESEAGAGKQVVVPVEPTDAREDENAPHE